MFLNHGVQRYGLPIFTAALALSIGIAIGRYTAPVSKPALRSHVQSKPLESPLLPVLPTKNRQAVEAPEEKSASSIAPDEDIVAGLKAALAYSGSRHSYAAFSKLMESVNEKKCARGIGLPANSSPG